MIVEVTVTLKQDDGKTVIDSANIEAKVQERVAKEMPWEAMIHAAFRELFEKQLGKKA